jgi:hypothetical protein
MTAPSFFFLGTPAVNHRPEVYSLVILAPVVLVTSIPFGEF